MEGLFTFEALAAFGTLVLIEVVLGIDNLVFIAILTDKLPRELAAKARAVGLGLALGMRLALLSVMSFMATLTAPFISVFGRAFSGRDCILLAGGLFLLFKATTELHERLEGDTQILGGRAHAGFWLVVAQITVLDAVFSLDAVITAVGMTQSLPIMMAAVCAAIAIMLAAARPLTDFVNRHPTVVVLCLSFLLLIGLSLLAEAFGFDLPKGYLYAAIGFSVLIETFNQVALHNARRNEKRKPMRLRTAEAVLRLLGAETVVPENAAPQSNGEKAEAAPVQAFAAAEVNMVSRVLTLSERPAGSVMTHRSEAAYVDLDSGPEAVKAQLLAGTPSVLPVCRGGLDNIAGTAHAAELLADLVTHGHIRPETIEEPHIVPESLKVLTLLEIMREKRSALVLVADEYGSIEGLITFMDLFEAIAGEVPDDGEAPEVEELEDGRLRLSGAADVHFLEQGLSLPGLVSENNSYTTLAGFLLSRFGRLPEPGDSVEHQGRRYTVEAVQDRRITLVLAEEVKAPA